MRKIVTTTKTSINPTSNSIDFSTKASKTNLSRKSTSELYKADDRKSTSKSEDYKREDFKEVLSSKTNSKDEYTQKVDDNNKNEASVDTKDTTKVDELKGKLEELEEDSKSASKDDVNDILTELLNLLTKLGIKQEDLKSNGAEASKSNSSSVMDKVIELLKNDSVKGNLDTDSLKSMEKILSNLSTTTDITKDIKSGMKNLMSEISNMLDNKQSQSGKVLTLEDMLNKNYSQDNKESSTENESNTNDTPKATKEDKFLKEDKSLKEDKFLNSLIDDNKDSSTNKINLFASRTQTIQNQGVETARGLTINKATFTDDLVKDVKFMSTNALKELTVKINPGNLGEITIKLVQEDGVMKANLKANSKETTALLAQNLVDIKKQLGEQNIKIADVNIEIYKDDTTFFSEQGFGRQFSEDQGRSNDSNSNNAIITEEDLTDNITSNNNIEIFA